MKCIIVRRRFISLVVCAALAVAMIVVVNHPVFVGASATTRHLPIYCVQKDYKVCAISFDAAWANANVRDTPFQCIAHIVRFMKVLILHTF